MRMTLAPQSAKWRTAVGPARASVRSSTVMPFSGRRVSVNTVLSIGLSGIVIPSSVSPDTLPPWPIAQDRPPRHARPGVFSPPMDGPLLPAPYPLVPPAGLPPSFPDLFSFA